VPGRGEFFLRDSGGDGQPVLLLHGWMFNADLNWGLAYPSLIDAGYRVLAIDHRGHGRGLRSRKPFRLSDCAADCAAVLRETGAIGATAVGYSMGGAITQLLAHDHRDSVNAVIMCATSAHWSSPLMKRTWRAMPALRVALGVGGVAAFERALDQMGFPRGPRSSWVAAELSRGSARDIAEAGRELGRHDARSWLSEIRKPAASVITTLDRSVPPEFQVALATGLGASIHEVAADHLAASSHVEQFNSALLEALASVNSKAAVTA
jgi:3-oxoadipate enol-lactonase